MPEELSVEVIALHLIHCNFCGRIDDRVTDRREAEAIRRRHLDEDHPLIQTSEAREGR